MSIMGAEETVLWLSVLAVLVEDLGSIFSTYIVVIQDPDNQHTFLVHMGTRHTCGTHTYMQISLTHKNSNTDGKLERFLSG